MFFSVLWAGFMGMDFPIWWLFILEVFSYFEVFYLMFLLWFRRVSWEWVCRFGGFSYLGTFLTLCFAVGWEG